jgi:hypothetical protein
MLLLASSVCGLFKWRQSEPEVILLTVGWYLRFSLSYRDVEELLAERGLHADHVTIWRWVQRYASEIKRRLRSRLKPTNDSWRVDETYIRVKGRRVYLYRAVDSSGATIDFLTQDGERGRLSKPSTGLTPFCLFLPAGPRHGSGANLKGSASRSSDSGWNPTPSDTPLPLLELVEPLLAPRREHQSRALFGQGTGASLSDAGACAGD